MEYKPPSTPRRIVPRHAVTRSTDPEAVREALAWAAEHRGRPPRAFAPSAGRAAARIAKPLAKQFGTAAGELDARWSEIVGEQLAKWSRPEKFQAGAGGAVLVVTARGPAAALIEAQSTRILDRVAQYAGRRPARLKIIQGTLAPAAAKPPRRSACVVKVPAAPPLPADPKARLAALLKRWQGDIEAREGIDLSKS
ncbi:DUF721 domain-containing protein [Marinicauda algicola]|uniref:DUF721 domain-containing protein n=1 Tax=Marinicauda algicola TaxID=2029849 RepID=A0A4S2GWU0_9PROT|nr:DUF721 domain-containing protein [Marinicauda algicola]TGY87212.1 DUF721 domain-containing protein [Marinicauda algicola]